MATGLEPESLTQGSVLSARQGGPRGTAPGSWAWQGRAKKFGPVVTGGAPRRCFCRSCFLGSVCMCVCRLEDDNQELGERGVTFAHQPRLHPTPRVSIQTLTSCHQIKVHLQLLSDGSYTGQGLYISWSNHLPPISSKSHLRWAIKKTRQKKELTPSNPAQTFPGDVKTISLQRRLHLFLSLILEFLI